MECKQLKSRKKITKSFVVMSFVLAVSLFILAFVLGKTAYAFSEFYTQGESACLNASGGRSDFLSVQYACGMATCNRSATPGACKASHGQNACTAWLGPVGDSSTRIIHLDAPSADSSVDIQFFGMCTDRKDPTSAIAVINDNDSIQEKGFTRPGTWGSPSGPITSLNVSKFIAGAQVVADNGTTKTYYRMVGIGRGHSDAGSFDGEVAYIYVTVGGQAPEPTPPPTLDICSSEPWGNPSTYDDSDELKGTTSIDIGIRNVRFGWRAEGTWHAIEKQHKNSNDDDDVIYAMPTDEIAWHTCYWPGVQTTAETEVSSVGGIYNNWGNYNTDYANDDVCYGTMSVSYKKLHQVGLVQPWRNGFTLSGPAQGGGNFGDYGFSTDVRSKDNNMRTKEGDAGRTFTENASTWDKPEYIHIDPSRPSHDPHICACCPDPNLTKCEDPDDEDEDGDLKCTCYDTYKCTGCCTNTYASDLMNVDTIKPGPATDKASVLVPYNFSNRPIVHLADDFTYAGETIEVSEAKVRVEQKRNNRTEGTYATQVPYAKVKMFAYASSNSTGGGTVGDMGGDDVDCSVFDSKAKYKQCKQFGNMIEFKDEEALNAKGRLGGAHKQVESLEGVYNSYDVSAGDFMCFVVAVYPAQSNGDTDMSGGNGMWRFSQPACAIVAKRPTFQVWGGDMYTNSTIKAKVADKRNVYAGYKGNMGNFTTQGSTSTGKTHYGSWVEEGLVIGASGGVTTGGNFAFASGAALGYRNEPEKANTGVDGDLACSKMAPLTIANSGGSCGYPSGIGSEFKDNNDNRRELIDYWVQSTQNPTASGAKIVYSNSNSIGNVTVPKKETWIYDANGIFTITGNIKYEDGYNASSTLRDIPKVVIYADNVNISCNVIEVDAIIITKAGGKVDTCSEHSNVPEPEEMVDNPMRSNPLRIFGMVITDYITLGRTYGSAAWKDEKCSSVNNDLDKDRYDPRCNGQLAAAEVFDFDSSILLWSEFMASAAETDTMQVVYQNEIAPRY